MVTKLEKQFFSTFGIEPKIINVAVGRGFYIEHNRVEQYPQITDSILLELICLLNNYGKNDTWAVSVENLKDCILMNCIKVIKEKDLKEISLNNFKRQVRTLFEEG